jgi:hypothetical protein
MKTNKIARSIARKTSALSLAVALLLFGAVHFETKTHAQKFLFPPPVAGDIIINEYAADNDASDNDFIELLVITDNLDLRGLRFSDNELVGGTLNTGEAVFVFGTDAFLSSVPKGTTIALYSTIAGVTTDTVASAASGDWKMILAPGTGYTISADGLGGTINPGFANGGEALYLYLPGADGTSAGTDNIYLDFVSFENDGGEAPAGLVDLNLPAVADNAYYRGNTAAGNDTAANWTTYDFPPAAPNVPTPGDANPSQDLSNIRIPVGGAPTITENTATPFLNLPASGSGNASGVIADPTDPARILGIDFTIADSNTPVNSLVVTATSSNQAVVPNANLSLTGIGAARNLKITPAGVGYATITVTVTDGTTPVSYTINYAASAASTTPMTTVWHTGKADASTAQAIDVNFMLVADDEDQTIRLYDRNESGLPLNSINLTSSLALTDINNGVPREVDIEGSARIGDRIYWVASHSNSSSGAIRVNRYRLFATDIAGAGANSVITYVGRYDGLRTDLLAWDSSNAHGLGANFFGLTASAAPPVIPEEINGGGFNIEGLTIAPDGATAYLAFRAPIVPATARTKALIVPITNFASLVSGNPSAGPATFGTPIQLDLGGRGIRSIEKNAANQYLIVAGTAGGASNFALYSWTGNPASVPILRTTILTGLNPESIVGVPDNLNDAATLQLLSDNGDDVYYNDGVIAKELPNEQFKKFRSDIINLAAVAPVSISGRLLASATSNKPAVLVSIALVNTRTGERIGTTTDGRGNFVFGNASDGETYRIEVRRSLRPTQSLPFTINGGATNLIIALQ